MVLDDLPNLEDIYTSLCSSTVEDSEMDFDSGLEDDDTKSDSILEDSTIFVAFKGNIDDKDFKWKLDAILKSVPSLLHMGFLIVHLAYASGIIITMVLDDLPNLEDIYTSLCSSTVEDSEMDFDSGLEDDDTKSDSILEDSTIFVAFKGNIDDKDFKWKLDAILKSVPSLLHMESSKLKVQKVEPWNSVRVTFNIPREAAERLRILAQSNNQQLRDLGILSVQIEGEGAINLALAQNRSQDVRMNGPMGAGNSVRMEAGFPMAGGPGLIRMSTPATVMIPQGGNVSSSMMAPGPNPELQPRTPRPASQSGWNQLPSGALQPPPAQGSLGTMTANQGWKKAPLPGPMQQQLQARPSLATVQTPSHPPPPYPFGSQQASQTHTNFPQMSNPGQFTAPQMKSLQGGPSRVPTPLQQPHLTNKSPASSPSSFQQGSPASSPTVNQTQQQMGPRPPQNNPLPQGFQQPVSSPGRNPMVQQGNVPPNFMVMQQQPPNQGPQSLHPGLGGWNQLPSGALQPPPAQGSLGTMTANQGWKKAPLPGPMQQQLQARPSLATVQTPSHPPPPYPFGSQQASQTHTNFPQMSNPGQFTAPQMKSLQGGPSRVPTPLQQPHLTNKSPASSPSSFQQGSPASSPTVNQTQQQMGPRPPQNNPLPQGFQQPVSSPGRNPMVQQGNVPPNFMVMQQQPPNQGPQSLHPGLGGGQGAGPPQNQMQVSHGPPNMMQPSLMGIHGNMNNQQAGSSGVPQVNLGNMQGQPQQGPPSQLMGMHQPIVPSQGQMVQQQGTLNPQNPMILSRAQLLPQGQMMVNPQSQNLGPSPQRMTPPKQMLSQQGPQMMAPHNQMMGPQGQVLLQQNPMIEQIMTNQMQGNKQQFNTQNQSNVMPGPAQIMRGPTPNMQGNMVQFTGQMSGQMLPQQGPVNNSPSQVMGIQGQVLRPPGPSPHMAQQHGDPATTANNDVSLSQMMPDVSMQQTNMVPPHVQAMQGNSASGNHFSGHGMPFNAPFSGAPNGNQMSCGQNPGFPVNKDVTLTSPLLVNLLQSDISAGHFGVNNKQNNTNANKPKKKKPPRKKKNSQQDLKGPLNPDSQRMPMQQSGNVPVMVSLQGPASVPPSPDKQRMPMPVNTPLGNNSRKMVYQENPQNPSSSPLGEMSSLPEASVSEVSSVSGGPNNMPSHLVVAQNQLMMTGPKPGPSPLSATQGATPQQPPVNSLPSSHGHHFPNVAAPTQTSRPKTPNRASPRPYYPQTPNNRPPSTEPSEISLSPERLNASIAGLFPPQINIPLPPRPNLNRGFDQQGLNPTTLKAIGQAPSNLTMNNPSNFAAPQTHKLDSVVVNSGKQSNSGATKRASPSNSRRSSPGSSRKTTPSPGRQNSKAPKLALTSQTNTALLQNVELPRNVLVSPTPLANPPVPGSFPNNSGLNPQNPTVPVATVGSVLEDNKESSNVPQDSECQNSQVRKEQVNVELKAVPAQEVKMIVPEEQSKKDGQSSDPNKLPGVEENKNLVSPAMREAPTPLSQLLDNSGAPNVTIKPPGLTDMEVTPPVVSGEDLKKASVIPTLQDPSSSSKEPSNSLNLPHNNEPCSALVHPELSEVSSNVAPSMPPVMSRPVSSSSISTPLPPNQITVFVTSNPITTSANTSAALPTHLQSALMSTVVTMPNVGSKVMVSEGQSAAQSNARPQFITPVFINSSSIIQVMKGSQPSTIPAAPLTTNSGLMPPSVAVVGPLHIPQNIKFSSAPVPPNVPSSTPAPNLQTGRPLVLNSRATPVQLPSPTCTSSPVVPPHPPVQQVKELNPDEASPQVSTSADQSTLPSSQAATMVSPLLTNSPGSSANRRSPVSSSKGKGKVDKIGQILLTKACKKVTGSLEKGEEQYGADGETEGQGLETTAPGLMGTEQLSTELDSKTPTPPAPTLLKLTSSPVGPGSTSAGPSLPGGALPTSVRSIVTALVPSELISAAPSTKSNHGGITSEPLAGGLVEEKVGSHPELLSSIELEANAVVVSGQSSEPKEIVEKSKTPSRRNSRTEEPTVASESVENGHRKRSSRPASASSSSKG
ncbi:Nuclear receptor coactivator 6 [Tupaia chinensis]|uniref:Nuclear receptor coactivator 6 n=1 Tax=Tupaia chinensis TaxID=246437 RepID=L9L7B4_TUPCH|nr:Nuclear receptor coactivator 6 [Tupaia chinensis]